MRFWHWQLLPFLPKDLLLESWKDLKSYFQGKRNILVSYVDDFPAEDLFFYSIFLARAMSHQGLRTQTKEIILNYFKQFDFSIKSENEIKVFEPFEGYHDKDFYFLCLYLLEELRINGKTSITEEVISKIVIHGIKIYGQEITAEEKSIEDLA